MGGVRLWDGLQSHPFILSIFDKTDNNIRSCLFKRRMTKCRRSSSLAVVALSAILFLIPAHMVHTPSGRRTVLNPVVFVPGIAGSGLFANRILYAKRVIEHPNDMLTMNTGGILSKWYRLWASFTQVLTKPDRWARTMSLLLPNCTHNSTENYGDQSIDGCVLVSDGPDSLYRSPPGITVISDPPGATTGFEYLDYTYGIGVYGTKYFADLVTAFRAVGYRDLVTLFGFPYDWRLPVRQTEFAQLKMLIETAQRKNRGLKVDIISHSLGSVVVNYFLNSYVDKQWKDKTIHTFTTLNGAFGGSPKIVHSFLSGGSIQTSFMGLGNITFISAELERAVTRQLGSMYSLVPSDEVYSLNYPLVSIKSPTMDFYNRGLLHTNDNINRTSLYSDDDIQQHTNLRSMSVLDDDITFTRSHFYTVGNWSLLLSPQMRALAAQGKEHMTVALRDPQVPVYCIWTKFDEPTTESEYIYNTPDFDVQPTIKMTYGDHTLPIQSLDWCSRWNSTKYYKEIPNLDHMGALLNDTFNEFVVSLVAPLQPSLSTEWITHLDKIINTIVGKW